MTMVDREPMSDIERIQMELERLLLEVRKIDSTVQWLRAKMIKHTGEVL